jgi:hypothetical protein
VNRNSAAARRWVHAPASPNTRTSAEADPTRADAIGWMLHSAARSEASERGASAGEKSGAVVLAHRNSRLVRPPSITVMLSTAFGTHDQPGTRARHTCDRQVQCSDSRGVRRQAQRRGGLLRKVAT